MTATTLTTPDRTVSARMLAVEVLDELRGIIREPTAWFFSVAMPVGFFLLFASMFGDERQSGLLAGTYMLTTLGTFGVLAVTLMNPGIGVAEDRDRGWLRAKRVSAVPLPVTLAAKVIAALPYAVGVLGAMAVAAAATGGLEASPGTLLRIAAVLVVGALPFALLSLAIGFRVGPNAAAAILNGLLLPAAVVSGLWMPLEQLPDFLSAIATYLPTYHLSQLAMAQLEGGGWIDHALALLAFAAVAAVAAALSYRSARP